MGMTGRYGFYEAADFTKSRCGNLPFAIVRSYMAHHVGMSICAITNALFDDLLCKRFMSGKMGRAKILLFEKIPNGTGVYKRYVEPEIPEKPGRSISSIEKIDQVSPVTPKAHLLSNGELTLIASDSGLCSCKYRGYEVYRPTADPYTSPQGVIAVLSGGDAKFSLTSAPDYTKSGAPRAEFAPSYCAYYAKGGPIEGGMSVSLHEKLPCEIRTFKIRNRSGKRIQARLTIYFEPCMFSREDSFAHPAFNRLFIESHFSQELSALVFTRRTRDGESPMSLVVGFSDARPFYYDCSRESVLSRPYGTKSLLWEVISGRNAQGVPDTCCGIEIALALSSHSQKTARLILSSAATEEEAARNFLLCREDPSAPQDGIPRCV